MKKNHEFYNGAKPKTKKIDFVGRKIYQYCSRVYQKMRKSNIEGGGGVFFFNKSSLILKFFESILLA